MTTNMFRLLYSNLVISSFITITGFLAWVTRRVPLAKQELPTLPKHLRSIMTSNVVHCLKSLNVVYCWSCVVFSFFSSGHSIVCLSLIYSVADLPIGSTGWILGAQNLGGRRLRWIIFLTLLLDFHTYVVITYFLNNPSVIFLTQLHSMQNIAEF